MKQKLPLPIVIIVIVCVVAAAGALLYRSYTAPTADPNAKSQHVRPPDPTMKKPDFSSMSKEQIEKFKQGPMGGAVPR